MNEPFITTADWCELAGRELSDEMLLAAFYLEAKGLHLFVDFDFFPGQKNAFLVADEIYAMEAA